VSDSEPGARPKADLSSCPTCKAVFRGGFQRCPSDGSRLTPGGDDPLVGTVLAERYHIDDVIGDGGIGRVYRARHTRMSRRFAIKVPFGEVAYDRKQRARLSNEAEAASRLSHPNVIGIVDVGETSEGLFYMAMDLADGASLADIVADGPMSQPRALALLAQIADGLAHAHERELVHRDLKPENVIVSQSPDGGELARIVDFGLAIVGADEPRTNRLTTNGIVLGTPHYMSPEQATDEPLDFRTDLFALGLILFEMIAGIHPFDGGPMDVARQNLSRELPTIHERSGVRAHPLLEALVTWMTQKVPDDRPGDTAVVARIARALLAGDEPTARELLPAHLRPKTLEPALADARVPPVVAPPTPTLPPQAEVLAPPLPTERVQASGRRRFAIILVAVIAALALVLGVALLGGGGDGDELAALVDAAVVAPPADASVAAVIDAAEMIAEPVDAAEPSPVVVDAGRRPPPPRPVDAAVATPPPRPIDAAVSTPPPRPIDAGVTPPTSNATLRQLYEQVGRALDAAIATHGNDKTAAYKRRYAQIPPYLEAVRKDDLRAQAEAQLRALQRDLAALK